MPADHEDITEDRGREAVKHSLIEAACAMLAEVGPNSMSVRSVANRAGVNHGQVHHYFGGKQGLIVAAMRHLSQAHYDKACARDDFAEPLALREDTAYSKALVRLVLDGDIETATLDVREGISVPEEFRRAHTRQCEAGKMSPEVKARIAMTFAMELGWAALEDYVMQITQVHDDELDEVREHAKSLAREFTSKLPAGPIHNP